MFHPLFTLLGTIYDVNPGSPSVENSAGPDRADVSVRSIACFSGKRKEFQTTEQALPLLEVGFCQSCPERLDKMIGIDWIMAIQELNLLILVGWIVLAIVALIRLRHRQLDQIVRVLWVIVVLLVPVMGALAFFIVEPGKSQSGEER